RKKKEGGLKVPPLRRTKAKEGGPAGRRRYKWRQEKRRKKKEGGMPFGSAQGKKSCACTKAKRKEPIKRLATTTEQGKRKRAGGTPALQIKARGAGRARWAKELWRGVGESGHSEGAGGGVEGRRNIGAVRSFG